MRALEVAKKAKAASLQLLGSKAEARNHALKAIAQELRARSTEILAANQKDVAAAQAAKLSSAIIDRLQITEKVLQGMVKAAQDIAAQVEVVGEIVSEHTRADGLIVRRERIPLGVIAMVFESRPNVVIEASSLAIKSGNAIILKGGKEAKNSNLILSEIVRAAIAPHISQDAVQLLEAREEITELLSLNEWVDVIIPRGGEALVRYVYENAKMPVIAHFAGVCHGYIHSDADLIKAQEICLNAKASRPGVCNAMETLLLNKNLPESFAADLFKSFKGKGVELRASADLKAKFSELSLATEDDWRTEYLDKILAVKSVATVEEAISHIQKYGTHHTEFICAKDKSVIEKFKNSIDASCIAVNASSRFNDGGELGLGAELGISTSKFHAYGPMGAREMTTVRFIVIGDGHIRV